MPRQKIYGMYSPEYLVSLLRVLWVHGQNNQDTQLYPSEQTTESWSLNRLLFLVELKCISIWIFSSLYVNPLSLFQAQFISTGSRGLGQWIVPITLCCGSYEMCHSLLLSKKSHIIDLNEMKGCSCSQDGTCPWIKVNTNQTGFYRVNYEEDMVSRLLSAVKRHDLSSSDRFGNSKTFK